MERRLSLTNLTALTLGFAFLYIPILLLIAYSFNESRLVTVWGGVSTKWYGELARNTAILDAAWMTVKVGLVSSTVALVLGTVAGLLLARMARFPRTHALHRHGLCAARHARGDHGALIASALRVARLDAAGFGRSRSPTPPSRWPMSPWSCSRAS